MNKGLLIGFGVVVALVLAFPLLAAFVKQARESGGNAGTGRAAPAQDERRPADARQEPRQPAPQPAAPAQAPMLNAQNLVGTTWAVNTEMGRVLINLQAGGVAIAQHPLVQQLTGQDSIQGTWSVSGSQLHAAVTAMGQTQRIVCEIRGDRIFYQGQEIQRVR